jgi:hypothetical protein
MYPLLYDCDSIVIRDNEFKINIGFPLESDQFITIKNTDSTDGFTLRELSFIISNTLHSIYEEENETAEPYIFTITRVCDCKENIELKEYINENNDDEHCSICYSELNTFCQINCQHKFHKKCILDWVIKGEKTTCPLCRQHIYTCNKCNNQSTYTFEVISVELPLEHRSYYDKREPTNGIWKIGTYFYEELILSNLIYNKCIKTLQIHLLPYLF